MSKSINSVTILNGLKIAIAAIIFQTVVATTPATASHVLSAQTEQATEIKG